MEKIILKFIKDFSNRNKRVDYILDFKNNFICYKNCALYKADLRMFNYDYMSENGVRLNDFTQILNSEKYEYNVKFDCIRKIDKISVYSFNLDNMFISVDEKLVKLVDNAIQIKGISPYSPVKFYDENENLSALILPVKYKRWEHDRQRKAT